MWPGFNQEWCIGISRNKVTELLLGQMLPVKLHTSRMRISQACCYTSINKSTASQQEVWTLYKSCTVLMVETDYNLSEKLYFKWFSGMKHHNCPFRDCYSCCSYPSSLLYKLYEMFDTETDFKHITHPPKNICLLFWVSFHLVSGFADKTMMPIEPEMMKKGSHEQVLRYFIWSVY